VFGSSELKLLAIPPLFNFLLIELQIDKNFQCLFRFALMPNIFALAVVIGGSWITACNWNKIIL